MMELSVKKLAARWLVAVEVDVVVVEEKKNDNGRKNRGGN
jgi:hypothetical protein